MSLASAEEMGVGGLSTDQELHEASADTNKQGPCTSEGQTRETAEQMGNYSQLCHAPREELSMPDGWLSPWPSEGRGSNRDWEER